MSVTGIAEAEAGKEAAGKGGRKKVFLIGLLVIALGMGAAWWFMIRPASAEGEPEPGAVLKLDAIQVNLAGGHYLRIGIALQASKDAGEELDGSKALDATIDLFSGQDMERLTSGRYRNKLKAELEKELDELYDGEVIGVYLTDFVTQ
ncbi:MAG TPA: flagellar basal body-associated FliL family protein [Nocardioidaceae bacterium]|jgi:flagellar FliL protein